MKILASGELHRIYDPNDALGRFYYTPLILIVFQWMGNLSISTNHVLWLCFHSASFLIFWVCLNRLYPTLFKGDPWWGWIVVWILSINPIHANFQCQNIQLPLMAVLLFCEVLRDQKSLAAQWAGGALWAFVAPVKLFTLFMTCFYFLVANQVTRRGILAGLFASLALPLVFFGPDNGLLLYKRLYWSLITYHGTYPLGERPELLSLPSLLTKWGGLFVPRILIQPVVTLFTCGFGLLFFVFVWKKRGNRSPEFQRHLWALSVSLMVLLNSTSRPDYFIFYVPALCSLVELWRSAKDDRLLPVGILVSLLLIAFTSEWVVGSKAVNNQVESWRVPVVGMVLLCAMLSGKLRIRLAKR